MVEFKFFASNYAPKISSSSDDYCEEEHDKYGSKINYLFTYINLLYSFDIDYFLIIF